MPIEQTLSIIKPDGVKRKLVGEILKRFENKGLRIVTIRSEEDQADKRENDSQRYFGFHRMAFEW